MMPVALVPARRNYRVERTVYKDSSVIASAEHRQMEALKGFLGQSLQLMDAGLDDLFA